MSCIKKLTQHITKNFRSLQEWAIFPYGKFIEADGAEVIFDRRYRPICRVFLDRRVEVVNPRQWINFEDQSWFYNSINHPCNNKKTRTVLLNLIEELGLAAELMARRELEENGGLPSRACREWTP